jgi:hypothetical protein
VIFPLQRSWFPPQMIVDVLYCVSKSTLHSFSVCFRSYPEGSQPYTKQSSNPIFYMNVHDTHSESLPKAKSGVLSTSISSLINTPHPHSPHIISAHFVNKSLRESERVLEEFWKERRSFMGFHLQER